ncbi:MAG: ATP-binding protein [Chloroflexi bacterium]|nr:ATP-binding protein [Chloroflexota bacterium]
MNAKHPRNLSPTAEQDARALLRHLPPLPAPARRPVVVVLSGLPGTGKSTFGKRLGQRVPLAVLESDALRRLLVRVPTYAAEESARLFDAIHQLIGELLGQRVPVLLDATNLVEAHRQQVYAIAEKHHALLLVVRLEAPRETVRQRLARRAQDEAREDSSEAGWEVYERMRPSVETIQRPHLVIDTSRDLEPAVSRLAQEVQAWLAGEQPE